MDKPKVVVALLSEDQEFQKLQADDAVRAAARAGIDVEVLYAKNNAALQAEQIYKHLHGPVKPVAIIAHPVQDEKLTRVAGDAAKLGIAWIQLGRESEAIERLRMEFPAVPISIVGTDQQAIGRIQGEQCRAFLPNGGTVLIVQGPPNTSSARQRLEGLQAAIAGTSIQTRVINAEWTEASAEQAVTSWLRLSSTEKERLQLVAAQNDAMASGARKAITARRPDWANLPFLGVDGVAAHDLAATVVVPSYTGPAIDLIAKHLKDGSSVPPRVVLAPKAKR
jgi:ribose transport system substrate-binding protein